MMQNCNLPEYNAFLPSNKKFMISFYEYAIDNLWHRQLSFVYINYFICLIRQKNVKKENKFRIIAIFFFSMLSYTVIYLHKDGS